jgi:acyl-CoA thioesterase FadM
MRMTTLTPAYPKHFTFYAPIAVRYADLDPQRHVNNIAVLEYVETARTLAREWSNKLN